MTTYRFLTLRPSTAIAQARREAAAAGANFYRSRRRAAEVLEQGDVRVACDAGDPVDLEGLVRWYSQLKSGGSVDHMRKDEQEAFRKAAWASYHQTMPPDVWLTIVKAARERQRDTGVLADVAWWNRARRSVQGNEGR